jgi:hypothetical protein
VFDATAIAQQPDRKHLTPKHRRRSRKAKASLNGVDRTQAGSLCYINLLEREAMFPKHLPRSLRTKSHRATALM